MNQNLIFYPCFALLILTSFVLVRMFVLRVLAIKEEKVDFRYFKTYDHGAGGLPVSMVQASRNFSNLFEVPTLFYMVCAFGLITQNVDGIFLWLAWLYVAFRYLHSAIHLTSNRLIPRMGAYAGSWVILLAMAFLLAMKIYSSL